MRSIKQNAILNSVKQICTVLFPLVTFPYISRVLGNENYGKVSFSQSIVSYFSLLAALGISNYAVREGAALRNNRYDFEVFSNEIFTINLISTLISYICLIICVFLSRKLQGYSVLIFIQSASLIFATIGVEWIYVIHEDFFYITIRTIFVQILSMFLVFTIVRKEDDYFLYAFLTVFSSGGINIFNYVHSRRYVRLKLTKHLNLTTHFKPMLFLFFNTLMISIYVNSDLTMLGFFKEDSDVGIYTVSVKVYTIVKGVLNAVVIVVAPRLAAFIYSDRLEEYKALVNKTFGMVITLLFPITIGLLFESSNILKIIAGDSYISGSTALRILSGAMLFSIFAAAIVNLILLPWKKDKIILTITCISAGINVLLNFILIPIWGIDGAAFTTMLAELVVFLLGLYYSKTIISINLKMKNIISTLLGCVAIAVLCIFMGGININYFAKEIITVALASVLYIVILAVMKNDYLEMIITDMLYRLKKIGIK